MGIKRQHINSVLKALLILVEATVLSCILAFVIREFIGREFFLNFILYPAEIYAPYPINLGGLLVIGLGFIFVIWANYTLLVIGKIGLRAREPFQTPSNLILEGPYKFGRNPIYLGVVLILLGFAIATASITIFILTVVLFLIFRNFFVGWEEKKLEEVFGEEYLEYKQRVRRWL